MGDRPIVGSSMGMNFPIVTFASLATVVIFRDDSFVLVDFCSSFSTSSFFDLGSFSIFFAAAFAASTAKSPPPLFDFIFVFCFAAAALAARTAKSPPLVPPCSCFLSFDFELCFFFSIDSVSLFASGVTSDEDVSLTTASIISFSILFIFFPEDAVIRSANVPSDSSNPSKSPKLSRTLHSPSSATSDDKKAFLVFSFSKIDGDVLILLLCSVTLPSTKSSKTLSKAFKILDSESSNKRFIISAFVSSFTFIFFTTTIAIEGKQDPFASSFSVYIPTTSTSIRVASGLRLNGEFHSNIVYSPSLPP
mmetsp:Transcript_10413/g.19480  ORF Transcript_10413/g.19480 Transcript_10413/m.19480 type:complete len:306 (-) Transcript_10413:475-1392(-)